MTASLPREVRDVFGRFVTCEYTTVDRRGQPITWPVNPYYEPDDICIDLSTGLGYPKKANDARANPKVALLFSDPTGCGIEDAPAVLVQGTADVDDRDLAANRERYAREWPRKLPGMDRMLPPKPVRGLFNWYFTRIYVHVRPERVFVWPEQDFAREPQLLDSHMEEVRSALQGDPPLAGTLRGDEEPDAELARPDASEPVWDERMEQLGGEYEHPVLSLVAPDGFPFSVRVPVELDRDARRVRIEGEAIGAPLQSGLACLTAHEHAEDFSWQRNFQVRGDLEEDGGSWSLVPHKLVGGLEAPPVSTLQNARMNFRKTLRFRRTAKRELRNRAARPG
jgi:hypothetical protein